MRSRIILATTAAVVLSAGTALAQCDTRLQDVQDRHADLFSSGGDGSFIQGRPVLHDLRDAATRLQQQGLDEACERVVDAMETTIATYRQVGGPAATADTVEPAGDSAVAAPGPAGTATPDTTEATTTGLTGTTEAGTDTEAEAAARANVARGEHTPDEVRQRSMPLDQGTVPLDSSALQDKHVYSYDGEDLGDVGGIMTSQGRPSHLIISRASLRDTGSKEVAVPVDLIGWDPEWKSFVVPFTAEQLDDAPEYNRDAGADWDWTGNDQYWHRFRG